MQTMTGYERVRNTLEHKPVDQVACHDVMWDETLTRWRAEGQIGKDDDHTLLLAMDLTAGGSINSVADLDFKSQVVEETEDTILRLDGNGAMLRQHKQHNSCPEHVGFAVQDRASWEERIKPHLVNLDRRRIPFEDYRKARQKAAELQKYYGWWGVAPFEQMHPVCGHENLLAGFALDPDWARDMVMTYARFTLMHLEVMFAEVGKPDGMFFGEDMGFKEKPFMSPAMYREIMFPGHKLLFDWSHAHGLKVAVHSCGFVEPLAPAMVEAGMDCLQAMEVKAGMDIRHFMPAYTDRLAFWGNIDARALIANDRAWIDAELESKVRPLLEAGGAYILQSDHTIPPQVNFETMRYFFGRGRELSGEIMRKRR